MDARFLKFWYRSETIMQIRMKNGTAYQKLNEVAIFKMDKLLTT